MPHFFDYILKQKKLLFLGLLVVVLIGVALPSNRPAQAACTLGFFPPGVMDISGCYGVSKIIDFFAFLHFNDWGGRWALRFLIYIADVIGLIFYYLATGSAMLFAFVLDKILGLPITRQPAFLNAWRMMKNLSIILIILSLIATALMMILRIWVDKAKQLLPQIIITGLLINFSVVLVGFFIDLSNIIMIALLGTTSGASGSSMVSKVNQAWNAIIWPFSVRAMSSITNAVLYFSLSIVFDVMYIIVGLALLYFILILIERYIMFAILFILSPLAFGLRIVPMESAQAQFKSWWEHFLKFCFVGLGAAFFLRLSIELIATYTWDPIEANNYNQLLNFIFHFAIVMGFMIFGLVLTRGVSTPIANGILSVAGKVGGVGLGMVGGAAGMAGLGSVRDALIRKKDQVAETVVGLGESVGYYAAGTKARMKRENLQKLYAIDPEMEKTMEKDATIGQLQQKASMTAITAGQIRQKLAAIKILAKRGVALTEHQAQYAIDSGVEADEVVGNQAGLSHLNKRAIGDAELKLKDTTINPETGEAFANLQEKEIWIKEEAKNRVRRNTVARADKKFATEALEPDIIMRVNEALEKAKNLKSGEHLSFEDSTFVQEACRLGIMNKTDAKKAKDKNKLFASTDYYGYNARRLDQEKDPLMAGYSDDTKKKTKDEIAKYEEEVKANGSMPSDDYKEVITKNEQEKAVQEQASKMSGDKYADLHPEAAKSLAKYASPQTLQRAMVKGSDAVKEAIAEGILADVEGLTLERIALIPKDDFERALKEATNEVRDAIELKFMEGGIDISAISDYRIATKKDVTANDTKNREIYSQYVKDSTAAEADYKKKPSYDIATGAKLPPFVPLSVPTITVLGLGDTIELTDVEKKEEEKALVNRDREEILDRIDKLTNKEDKDSVKERESLEEFLRIF